MTAAHDTQALAACPFCGGPAEWNQHEGSPIAMDDPMAGAQWIECLKCGASTNLMYSVMDDCAPQLLEKWNRRAALVSLPQDDPVAQVVAVDPPGPDGHGVNWLKGRRPKPGALLYAVPVANDCSDAAEQFEFVDAQNHRMRLGLHRIAKELRSYNPAADQYKGEHIHGVWAREIENLLASCLQEQEGQLSKFPARILTVLHELADRKGTATHGPAEDANG